MLFYRPICLIPVFCSLHFCRHVIIEFKNKKKWQWFRFNDARKDKKISKLLIMVSNTTKIEIDTAVKPLKLRSSRSNAFHQLWFLHKQQPVTATIEVNNDDDDNDDGKQKKQNERERKIDTVLKRKSLIYRSFENLKRMGKSMTNHGRC